MILGTRSLLEVGNKMIRYIHIMYIIITSVTCRELENANTDPYVGYILAYI